MRRITLGALLTCISVFGLFGQATDGNLVGMITDASGAAISGAEVAINNRATNIRTTTTSNQSGEYRFNNLPVGSYDLSVRATGFGTMKENGVAIELNKTATVNISLQVGAVSQTVDVSDAAAAIDTTTAQVQSSFSAQQAKELPASSIGSGVLNLALLSAGAGSSGAVGYGTGPFCRRTAPDQQQLQHRRGRSTPKSRYHKTMSCHQPIDFLALFVFNP